MIFDCYNLWGHDETAKRYIKERRADAVIGLYIDNLRRVYYGKMPRVISDLYLRPQKSAPEHVYSFQKNDVQSEG